MSGAADKALASCAHNLRTSLAGLNGFARRYEEAAPGNDKVLRWNEIHSASLEMGLGAINRVVEIFGREIRLAPEDIDLEPFLRGILKSRELMDSNQPQENIQLKCPDSKTIHADPLCLQNALGELISNSQAMIDLGGKLFVQIEARFEMRQYIEWLTLIVRDNGPGVDSAKLEEIFKPLYSHRPNGEPSTGLGLSWVRRIAKAHGGYVCAKKEPEWGGVFLIEFPC